MFFDSLPAADSEADAPGPWGLFVSGERRENHAQNAIRGIAALLVVVSHTRALLFLDWRDVNGNLPLKILYTAGSLGHASVIIFFVLSGYWVGGAVLRQVQEGTFTWQGYVTQRLTRLWVVLLPALALTVMVDNVGWRLFPSADVYAGSSAYYGTAPLDLARTSTPLVALGNVVFVQAIHVPAFGTDTPLWSVAFEFWYYALFPLALLACWKGGTVARRVGCVVGVAAVAAIAGTEVLALAYAWALGILPALWGTQIKSFLMRSRHRWLIQVTSITCTLLAMLAMVGKSTNFTNSLAIATASTLMIAALAPDVTRHGRVLRPARILSALSRPSFSLYVIHLPLLALITALAVPDGDDKWVPNAENLLRGMLIVMALVAAAWMFWYFIERHTDAVRQLVAARLTELSRARSSKSMRHGRRARMNT